MLVRAIPLMGTGGLPSSAAAQPAASTSPCNWKLASTRNSAIQDTTDLAGRLGSTRDRLQAHAGQPTGLDASSLPPEYKIAGYGEVVATFDPDDNLIDFAISSPAAPDRKFEVPPPPTRHSRRRSRSLTLSHLPVRRNAATLERCDPDVWTVHHLSEPITRAAPTTRFSCGLHLTTKTFHPAKRH